MDAPKPCTKIRHKSQADAEKHRARLEAINARFGKVRPGFTLNVYLCPICSTETAHVYHVGHKREEPAS
jgi:hypothetical protein